MKNIERTVKIDLLTAKKWYNSNNEMLKELALKTFNKGELEEILFEEILDCYTVDVKSMLVPIVMFDELRALSLLKILAVFFNPTGWKPVENESKYFITKDTYTGDLCVKLHSSVRYPGIVYFKNQEDAYKVTKMIKENKEYFKSL